VLEGEEVVVDAPLGAEEALPILRDAIGLYARERENLRSHAVPHLIGLVPIHPEHFCASTSRTAEGYN
jgi:hypothetical protein